MKVEQVASIVNEALDQVMGEHLVLEQDLSNVVEVGKAVLDYTSLDNFVKALPDVVGKFYFTSVRFPGMGVGLMKDAWEYGAAMARIKAEMPIAVTNEVWELEDGQSYDPNVFHKPTVSAKYWQDRNSFDVEISIAKDQAKSCFNSAEQLNALVSAIFIECENTITIALDNLELLVLDTLIAFTIADEFSSGVYGSSTGIRAVDLYYQYKTYIDPDTTLDATTCWNDEKFLEYAAEQMGNMPGKLMTPSVLFNLEGKQRFTPQDRLNVIILDQIEKKFDIYLKSTRFHDNLVALPGHRTLPYWQGTGTDYSLDACSSINIKHGTTEVNVKGIVAVMFDDRAAMVSNTQRDTDVNYNGKARFYNYFYHVFNGLLIDTEWNCVVFGTFSAVA